MANPDLAAMAKSRLHWRCTTDKKYAAFLRQPSLERVTMFSSQPQCKRSNLSPVSAVRCLRS